MAIAQQHGNLLVGTWRYVKEVDTRPDGSPAPVGVLSDCDGLLIYTADGFMSVNIMPRSRRWSADTATIEELRETITNGTAYAGRYRIDPANNTVVHVRAVSLEPRAETELVRTYRREGDKLILSGTFPFNGESIHFAITWQRIQ